MSGEARIGILTKRRSFRFRMRLVH